MTHAFPRSGQCPLSSATSATLLSVHLNDALPWAGRNELYQLSMMLVTSVKARSPHKGALSSRALFGSMTLNWQRRNVDLADKVFLQKGPADLPVFSNPGDLCSASSYGVQPGGTLFS